MSPGLEPSGPALVVTAEGAILSSSVDVKVMGCLVGDGENEKWTVQKKMKRQCYSLLIEGQDGKRKILETTSR